MESGGGKFPKTMFFGLQYYIKKYLTGVQHALLAPVGGMFVAEPTVKFQTPMKKGDLLAKIVNVYGDVLAELKAPVDGMFFGLHKYLLFIISS